MSADETRIREFAYQIWESEGRPDGQDLRHWEMARKLAESEAAGQAGKQPTTSGKRISKPRAVTLAAAEASADEPALLKKPRAPRTAKPKAETEKPALLQKPRAPRTPKA